MSVRTSLRDILIFATIIVPQASKLPEAAADPVQAASHVPARLVLQAGQQLRLTARSLVLSNARLASPERE